VLFKRGSVAHPFYNFCPEFLCVTPSSKNTINRFFCFSEGSRDGVVVIALVSNPRGSGSGHEWVKLVVGSSLCSERFFPGLFSFRPSSKINNSKLQFDRMQDLPESHFRLSGASWVNINNYYSYSPQKVQVGEGIIQILLRRTFVARHLLRSLYWNLCDFVCNFDANGLMRMARAREPISKGLLLCRRH